MRRAYLAGRFSRRDEFNGYAERLRAAGLTVDARWLIEDHEWYGEQDAGALQAARAFAMDDLEDVARADVVLVFTEPANPGGRNRGGRHVEYGLALGLAKDIVIIGEPENVFHNLSGPVFVPRDELHNPATRIAHVRDFEEALHALYDWLYVERESA
jgi:nucleoside 2-deoxyribosyltransferase